MRMQVGILGIFQNYLGRDGDEAMIRDEMRLAERAEPLGYDSYWPPEHHFTDYSACPDNVQFLSWLAARTQRLRLGTGAVIVPWNDPLRVAEKIAFLDHLSGGRTILGLGRGLARIEYRHFGIEMAEARARFDEAAPMIVSALETGVIEGAGPFYPQARTPIRPRPLASFRDRLFCVGLSPDSVDAAARLGARLMTLTQQPWEVYAAGTLAHYRESWRKHQAGEPPIPLVGDLMLCDESAERADALSREFISNYFLTVTQHYELLSDHFAKTQGYQHYSSSAELFRQVGLEVAAEGYRGLHCWGTPRQILEKLEARKRLLGGFDLLVIPRYGGLPFEAAEQSLRLFADEVLPELRSW
jgi:alkanesulfonate monooxygenase SsuD/methylene tetrahydromethanopterin reductase-like flavin-dependent oxidoreductase (luciferase family)